MANELLKFIHKYYKSCGLVCPNIELDREFEALVLDCSIAADNSESGVFLKAVSVRFLRTWTMMRVNS